MTEPSSIQLTLFSGSSPIVHFFDKNGALRTGVLIRRIKRGKHKGKMVVQESSGHRSIPDRVRNIEYP